MFRRLITVIKKIVIVNNKVVVSIATCCGIGKLPYMPGSWASLFSIIFCSLCLAVFTKYYVILPILLMFFLVGVWVSDEYSVYTGLHDAREIVIDEVVGQSVTIFVSISFANVNYDDFPNLEGILFLFAAFILFRLFDIFKPWPINFVDAKIKSGLGIMLDDVLAGLIAGLILAAFCIAYTIYCCILHGKYLGVLNFL